MHRFFIPHANGYEVDQRLTFPNETAHQLVHVLRMQVGTEVAVLDNLGYVYEAVLTAVSSHSVTGKIISKRRADGEPSVRLTLFQSLTRREKFEWVLQKGTEVGVHRFVPMVTQRSLVQETAVKPRKLVRWQKIVTEAAEQSHRGLIPLVESPVSFSEALKRTSEADFCMMAVTSGGQPLSAAASSCSTPSALALFIGPEGGFTEAEADDARLRQIFPITFGSRVYRTETAAVVGSALVLYAFEK